MTTPSHEQLAHQLAVTQGNGFFSMFVAAAKLHGLPVSFILAIGSRETNLTNILGDFQAGLAHGVGILQRDIQHPEARRMMMDGTWKTHPEVLIEANVAEMASDLIGVRTHLPLRSFNDQLHVVAAAYNCGLTHAIAAALAGDPDSRTTGHDYGRDVMARMAVFDALLPDHQ